MSSPSIIQNSQDNLAGVLSRTGSDFLPDIDFHVIVKNFKQMMDTGDNVNGNVKDQVGTVAQRNGGLPYGIERYSGGDDLIIKFQFLEDVKINERQPSYSSQNIFGRFEPLQIYSTSSPLEINLTLTYAALGRSQFNNELLNEEWVERMAAYFRSLTMPTYTKGVTFNVPPRLTLKIGNLVNNLPCYLKSISRNWENSSKYINIGNVQTNNFTADNTTKLTQEEISRNQDNADPNIVDRATYLPSFQKFDLTFTSFYKANQSVDSASIYRRSEGVTL